jgi:hypothetical protein
MSNPTGTLEQVTLRSSEPQKASKPNLGGGDLIAQVVKLPNRNTETGATRAGERRRFFQTVTVPAEMQGAAARLTLGLSGAAVQVEYDDVELRRAPSPAEQFSKPFSAERRQPRRTRSELEAYWQNRPPVAVQPPTNGQPLRLDGQVEPLCWLASDYWPGAWPPKRRTPAKAPHVSPVSP